MFNLNNRLKISHDIIQKKKIVAKLKKKVNKDYKEDTPTELFFDLICLIF